MIPISEANNNKSALVSALKERASAVFNSGQSISVASKSLNESFASSSNRIVASIQIDIN